MIRSLTFKWVVTLLLSSLTGVILVGLFAYRTTVNEFDRLRMEQIKTAFVSELASVYEVRGSWAGLDSLVPDNRRPADEERQLFTLADADGVIVLSVGPFKVGDRLSPRQLEEGDPVIVDGEQVGTALLALPPPGLNPREQLYVDRTNQALVIGALGAGVVALLIGIILSQQFLRPLSELRTAIAAMRQGDLNQQVQVRSRDELGELAQTFNDMSAQIHRANQLRKQMTADIAHDLRTPLMVMSGYLEALRDGILQPTPERFEAMHQEAVILKRLIEDLKTLSLADAGELRLIYQSLSPRDLLEQVKQSFDTLAAESDVRVEIDAPADLPPMRADRERMVQVLTNLVSNALRYTPAGGKIVLRARQNGGNMQLVVEDTGSGIPPDKLPNIFERFYRVEESRHQSEGESGLGLAIAKSIVEAHKGLISADSQVGVGTSMIITLQTAGTAPATA
ncbi:MAG: histidine kinase [Anaerolineaceae bacterium]|nr:histidine kinase [Anaerolineaceae bacterium]